MLCVKAEKPVRVLPVVLAVKFSLTPDLRTKTSLKIKFMSISVDAWLMLLPKPDFTLVATD